MHACTCLRMPWTRRVESAGHDAGQGAAITAVYPLEVLMWCRTGWPGRCSRGTPSISVPLAWERVGLHCAVLLVCVDDEAMCFRKTVM